jgi:hypothetical protein
MPNEEQAYASPSLIYTKRQANIFFFATEILEKKQREMKSAKLQRD